MPLDPFAVGVESIATAEGAVVNASNEVDLMAGDLFEVQARIPDIGKAIQGSSYLLGQKLCVLF